jgi:LacI family transcriptional regulator
MEKFAVKLLETKMTIIEIAQEMGLNDTKNIARQFKQIKGLTPLAYRRKFTLTKQSN